MKKKMNLAQLTVKSFRTSAVKGGRMQKGFFPGNENLLLMAHTGVPNCNVT